MIRYADFESFTQDFMAVRTAQRLLSIVGEALNKLRQLEPDIQIASLTEIIGLRNILIHGYDSIDTLMLWSILSEDLETLNSEIESLKA